MIKRKKRSFLLLELLIAIALFVIGIVPLVRMPMTALATEIKTYQRMQLHRYSDQAFIDIKSQLLTNEITWDQIDVPKEKKTLLSKEMITLDLKGIGKRTFERQCYIWSASSKVGKAQEQYRRQSGSRLFSAKR